jgi:hypothetical protein
MSRKNILGIVTVLTVISIISTVIYIKDQKVLNIINEGSIDAMSTQYVKDGITFLAIDASENATYIEINNRDAVVVKNEDLYEILSKYKSKKSRTNFFPYQEDHIVAKFSMCQNQKPRNFLLGDFNVWYESNDKKAYEIIDGDKLLEELIELANSSNINESGN